MKPPAEYPRQPPTRSSGMLSAAAHEFGVLNSHAWPPGSCLDLWVRACRTAAPLSVGFSILIWADQTNRRSEGQPGEAKHPASTWIEPSAPPWVPSFRRLPPGALLLPPCEEQTRPLCCEQSRRSYWRWAYTTYTYTPVPLPAHGPGWISDWGFPRQFGEHWCGTNLGWRSEAAWL